MGDTHLSCLEFVEKLASKTPTPGGGGAAALAGALGAALCSMVGNYTVGKKKYSEVEEQVLALMSQAEEYRIGLLNLVEKDAEAFEPLSRAYAYPKDAPDREMVLETATKNACAAPLEIVRVCGKVLDLLEEMGRIGSKMLISDVGCGAIITRSAMECAALNVYINTKSLKDRETAEVWEAEVQEKLARSAEKTDRITDDVNRAMR